METIFKALGDENRLRMIHLLSIGDLCVCELETILELSQSNVSRHMAKLKGEKMLVGEKQEQWIHYRVDPHFIENHRDLYNYLLEHFKEIEIYQNDKERYLKYKASQFNCETIKQSKEKVALLLNHL